MSASQAEKQKQKIEAYFSLHPEDKEMEGLKLDLGLFAMNLMHVVRAYGYDSVPMRGADFQAIHAELNLAPQLVPILLLPVGKQSSPGLPRVRYAAQEFTTIIK